MEVINQIHRGRLLAGLPLVVDSITVYSPKLIQIANIGYPIYNINLGVCINDGLPPHCMEYENKFDNVLQYDGEYLTYFLWGLEFFTSKTFVKQNECFIVADEGLRLDRNNFDGLVYLLKLANCVDPEKDRVKGMRNKDLDEKIAKAKRELNERLGRSPDEDVYKRQVYEFVEAASEDPETIEVVIEAASVAKKTAAEKLAEVINDNSEIVSAKAVTADADETVVVAYKDVGTDGNSIAVDKSCTNASWGADVVKLSGGKFGTPCPMKGLAVCIPDSSTPPVDIYHLCTNAGCLLYTS